MMDELEEDAFSGEMKAVLFACLTLLLLVVTIEAESPCPSRQTTLAYCKKPCIKDDQCKKGNKKCLCDGECGLSCINPGTSLRTLFISISIHLSSLAGSTKRFHPDPRRLRFWFERGIRLQSRIRAHRSLATAMSGQSRMERLKTRVPSAGHVPSFHA
jgi:hypothetical protein